MRFSTKIVIASVSAIIIFTAVCFVLMFFCSIQKINITIPTELIVSWYAFWTVELVMLSTIKVSKVKNKYCKEDDNDEEKG